MTLVEGSGFAVDVPPLWEVDIRPESAMLLSGDDGVIEPAVLHMANFQLPAELADYGDEIYTALGPADVFISVIDFGPLAPDGTGHPARVRTHAQAGDHALVLLRK